MAQPGFIPPAGQPANPYQISTGVGQPANPYQVSTAAQAGLTGLAPSSAELAAIGGQLAPQPQFVMPQMQMPASIAIDRTQNKLFVQGTVFDADDAAAALEAEALLDGPGTGLPTQGNWEALDVGAYQQYLSSIRNPSRPRLFRKGFETGVQQLKQLSGSALQLAGAEEFGGRIVSDAEREIAKRSPFAREFTDIDSGKAFVDWFVSILGTQGPMLIESVALGLAGAAVGSATAGPGTGTAGGFLAGVFGRKAFKEKVLDAAKKYRAGTIKPDSEEFKLLKQAAAITGATAANFAGSAVIGGGDIYGEMREQGVEADDFGARLRAIGLALPYATAETIPEFFIAGRLFGAGGRPALPEGASRLRRGAEYGLIRPAAGFAGYGAAEGLTEVVQEGIVMAGSGQDLTSDEALNRFVNAFAAGAAVGGTLGSAANLRSRNPDGTPAPESEQEISLLGDPTPEPTQLELPLEGGSVAAAPTEFGPQVTGEQGVLDIGTVEQPLREAEAVLRGQAQPQVQQPQIDASTQEQLDLLTPPEQPLAQAQLTRQGVLQFAPPAPEGIGFTDEQPTPPNAMQQAMRRAQEQRAFTDRETELAAQREIELEQLGNVGQAQRQLDFAQDQEAQELGQELNIPPPRLFGPTQPQQLDIFDEAGRDVAPRPSRREALRRGVARAQPTTQPDVSDFGPAPTQLSLFTQKGEPTVAAIKGAGLKTKTAPVKPKPRSTKSAGARGLKRGAKVAEVTVVSEYLRAVRQKYSDLSDAQKAAVAQELNVDQATLDRDGVIDQNVEDVDTAIAVVRRRPVAKAPKDAWEAADTGIAWEDLTESQRKQWTDSDQSSTTAETLADNVTLTPLQEVNAVIRTYEQSTPGSSEQTAALEAIAEAAYFLGKDTNVRAASTRALEYLSNLELPVSQAQVLDAVVVRMVNTQQRIEGVSKGLTKPWFQWAQARGLLPKLTSVITGLSNDVALQLVENNQLRLPNLPVATQKYVIKQLELQQDTQDNGDFDTNSNVAKTLADKIAEINGRTTQTNDAQVKKYTKELEGLWEKAEEQGLSDYIARDGVPLQDYFTATGKLIVNVINKRMSIATKKLTAEELRAASQTERADRIMAAAEADIQDVLTLDDWNMIDTEQFTDDFGDGRYSRSDGTPITKPVALGKIKLLVSGFLSRLRIKPKVSIYRNQADLRTRNPAMYARAVAARPQGDFDTASAVGYSFGKGEVIIFSDRVATEQQLKFVLAHETLGHFGFRGLMDAKQLNAALDSIYDFSPRVRAAVETYMAANPKATRREATEEYLADYAGSLDTNILARFWNSIKNALNRIGIKFEDDMARYLVSQSRQYVRNGVHNGVTFDAAALANRIRDIESMTDPDGSGRYSLAQPHTDEVNHMAADRAAAPVGYERFDTLRGVLQEAKDKRTNVGDFLDKVRSELTLMNYEARRNQGYRALYRTMQDTVRIATQLRTKYNDMMRTTLSPSVEFLKTKWTNGATKADLAAVNAMLSHTSASRHGQLTDNELRNLGDLVVIVDGSPQVNPAVLKELRDKGTATLEQLRAGFEYTRLVERPMTPEKQAELTRERDTKLAEEPDEKIRKDITREYKALIDSPTADFETTEKVAAMPELTKDSILWKMYNEVRSTMDEAAVDDLLGNYAAAKGDQQRIESVADSLLGKELTQSEKDYLGRVSQKFLELGEAGIAINAKGELQLDQKAQATANEFIRTWNEMLLANEQDKYVQLKQFLSDAEYDDITQGLNTLKSGAKIPKTGQERFSVQKAIENLNLYEGSRLGAELRAKRTIASGYVPFGREGSYQVRIQAVDPETGRIFKVSEGQRKGFMFTQVSNRAEAERVAKLTNELFASTSSDGLYNVSVADVIDKKTGERGYRTLRLKLVAQFETTRTTDNVTSESDLGDVIRTLTRFGVAITPQERHRLFQGLTRQDARARTRLRRLDVPGYDPNTLKYVAQHLEATASLVARKENRHRIDKLYDESDRESKNLWYGDPEEYNKRKKAWQDAQKDPSMPAALRNAIKQDYIDYHYTFVKNESPVKGNLYKDRGRRLVEFLEAQTDVAYSDFASGDFYSRLRMFTTFAQLGGSVATGALNLIALTTNVIPSMAGYNDKNNFGGGFGWVRSSSTLTHALNQTKNPAQSNVRFWNELLADKKKLDASGFTEVEARFMQKEVAAGSMQAALINALLGSARGKITTGFAQTAVRGWMSAFSYTEQVGRRATGLATFRLKYAQALQEGQTLGYSEDKLQQFAFDKADQFAVDMIDNTLGEYAMFNRPAMFRGGVGQFIYMYKTFVINSVLMLTSMDKKTALATMGILVFYAGLKGLPGAEDLMDILDTIAQTLGWGPGKLWRGTAEQSAMELIETLMPGMTPMIWRGFVNSWTPANIADRTSLGNLVPGTGIGLAGANVGQEIVEVLGPMASFIQQSIAFGVGSAQLVLETAGLKTPTTDVTSLARKAPITMLRAAGDIAAYNSAGAIVNQRGYVVSEDLTMTTYLARILGFYPAAAVRENDVVRASTRLTNYQRQQSALFRQLYVSARLANNNAKAQEVVGMVRGWNAAARGTGLEIPNFTSSANRALREARRTGSERLRKSAARASRENIDQLRYLYGIED